MRVSDNNTVSTVRDSLNRTRDHMAELQKENATLRRINAPSDDPVGNSTLMNIRNETIDNSQFERNSNLAKTFLNFTDSALESITNLVVRAKELAIAQASGAANGPESRAMVGEEVKHIQEETLSIANTRLGPRYIFSGYKTQTEPFDAEWGYKGDDGSILVEIQKDVFMGMNIPGRELFLGAKPKMLMADRDDGRHMPNAANDPKAPLQQEKKSSVERQLAEVQSELAMKAGASSTKAEGDDIFRVLEAFRVGLMTNDTNIIQSCLDPLDRIRDRVVSCRAQIGARMGGVESALQNTGKKTVFNAELRSGIEDADLVKVVSDMAREESVLKANLQTTAKMVQPSLLEFLR